MATATNQLPTTGSSQSQSVTQDPQSDVQPINSGSQGSGVQPGTATNLLSGQGGVSLSNPSLPTVSLGGNSPAATVSQPAPLARKHHVSPGLLALPVVLVVVAVVLVWSINRSAKSAL